MKQLSELIVKEEAAIELIHSWAKEATNDVEILCPSKDRENILLKTQITTHSVLGAVVYETGGILINNGWLRFIGSGHSKLQRVLPDWNEEIAKEGLYLVADDAAGGFFAVNGGAFEGDVGVIYYWPPDSFEWEKMDMQFSDFLHWSMKGDLRKFYEGIMWERWQNEVQEAGADKCINFYPPLWSKEGDCEKSMRAPVPAKEALDVKLGWMAQLNEKT